MTILPFFVAVWRQHPQYAVVHPFKRLKNEVFNGWRGHIGRRWHVVVGVVRPNPAGPFLNGLSLSA